jgi:hypothetical protein
VQKASFYVIYLYSLRGKGIMIKKILVLFVLLSVVGIIFNLDSVEAKKAKKGGIAEEDMTAMSTTVDTLTKKMYGNGLFSPDDNESLIDIKIKLDNQMLIASDPTLAPLYYKVAMLFKSREMKDEAVDCFQTVLENFADTALAPKAAAQLKLMGVEVKAPATPGASTAQ